MKAQGPRLDYRWHLRQLMAARGMFATTDLAGPLAARGIHLSSSQVYRLVVERPERLSLKVLMALLDILDCSMNDLIEPVAVARPTQTAKAADGTPPTSGAPGTGGGTDLAGLRPTRARIMGAAAPPAEEHDKR